MSNFRLTKAVRAGALGASLFLVAGAATVSAQNTNNDNRVVTNTRDDNRRDDRTAVREDDDRDWGWLGLLGLAGLLGLMPKKRVPVVVQETHDTRDRDTRTNR